VVLFILLIAPQNDDNAAFMRFASIHHPVFHRQPCQKKKHQAFRGKVAFKDLLNIFVFIGPSAPSKPAIQQGSDIYLRHRQYPRTLTTFYFAIWPTDRAYLLAAGTRIHNSFSCCWLTMSSSKPKYACQFLACLIHPDSVLVGQRRTILWQPWYQPTA